MLRISVLGTPASLRPHGIAGHVAAVIDVLRATSSITTAISSGCRRVIPASDRDDAIRLKASHPEALLGGEIGGRKIEGFDLGNSPAEYRPEVVGGKDIIMSTSNGTKAILGARHGGADPVLICSFLNLDAVAHEILMEIAARPKDVTIVCSGSLGQFSLEDFTCAGALVKALLAGDIPYEFDLERSAEEALETINRYHGDLMKVFEDSPHGQDLLSFGFGSDLEFCSNFSSKNVVPWVDNEAVVGHIRHKR